MKRVELKIGDKTVEGMLVAFETLREEYNSYKLLDGSTIRLKCVVTKYNTNPRVYPVRRACLHCKLAKRGGRRCAGTAQKAGQVQ